MTPGEVFLSHANADQQVATDVAELLVRHGVPVWYSRIHIVGAQQWHDEIGAALARCDWFVLILTPDAVGSMWVKRELLFALQEARFENKIAPLLFEPCDFVRLSWVLPLLQIIDFTGSHERGYRHLLRLWGIGYRP